MSLSLIHSKRETRHVLCATNYPQKPYTSKEVFVSKANKIREATALADVCAENGRSAATCGLEGVIPSTSSGTDFLVKMRHGVFDLKSTGEYRESIQHFWWATVDNRCAMVHSTRTLRSRRDGGHGYCGRPDPRQAAAGALVNPRQISVDALKYVSFEEGQRAIGNETSSNCSTITAPRFAEAVFRQI
ncbi:hypothetical protein EVAR_74269_1 [Eumeta japonica]|uniref:Uncharacterized protein n=1 Tax=Eumeta variegata TaxID=151549 RepID=A0A4C1SEU5_EUMVA|nr:hypothetical protein EVAR_74269_1 [Eumeta japonica]